MAKKKTENSIENAGGISSILNLVKSVDNSAEIIQDSAQSNIQEWIPSGNYILNACMSGDLFKAIPTGRIISFCGPSGCLPANEVIKVYVMQTVSYHHNIWNEKYGYATEKPTINKTYEHTILELKKELITSGNYNNDISLSEVEEAFYKLCEARHMFIPIVELFTKYRNSAVYVDTPDGWQLIGDIVEKEPRDLYTIKTEHHHVTCSSDHLIETKTGWIYAKDISSLDYVYTKSGLEKVTEVIDEQTAEAVYDFEVLHLNHRYYAGNGISSHNTGKSFLACSVCREAQKMGYTPIYMDSEGAIDAAFVSRLGVDPSRLIIKPVQTIFETSQFVANICKALEEQQAKTGSHDKIIFVLDSLGNLTSEKERDDTMSGNQKADFTKAKDVKAMFRVNATKLSVLGIPWIITNHIYSCCTGETEVEMSDHTYKHLEDIEIGDLVETLDGVHTITNKFEYDVHDYIEFEFEDGHTVRCTDKHKFLVKDATGESVYKAASEITELDEFVLNESQA